MNIRGNTISASVITGTQAQTSAKYESARVLGKQMSSVLLLVGECFGRDKLYCQVGECCWNNYECAKHSRSTAGRVFGRDRDRKSSSRDVGGVSFCGIILSWTCTFYFLTYLFYNRQQKVEIYFFPCICSPCFYECFILLGSKSNL